MMKACVLKDVSTFEVKEVERPTLMEDDEVLLKVTACSICGSDLEMRKNPAYIGRIFGHELCGVVEDPGKSTRLKKGDRIIMNTGAKRRGCPGVRTDGGYAEYVLVEEDDCLPMPENISDHIGSLLEPLAIGYGIAEMADIQPGDKVLITGCGIIASMVARWAKYRGASYIAMTEISEVKIAKAEEIGTPAQFFHAADPDLVDKLLAASDGGFDKAVDCPGNAATLNLTLDVTRPLGIIVEAAIHYKPVEFNYLKLVMKRLTLRGFYLYSPYFKEVIRIMSEEAPFDPTVFVSEEIDIDGIPDAVERLSAPDSDLLKVVIHP